jgi:hypothetical protein
MDLTIPNIIAGILLLIVAVPAYCLARKIGQGKRIKTRAED